MLKFISLAAVAATLAAAPLAAHAAPTNSCLRISDIQNTRPLPDDKTVYLRASTGAYYKLEFGAACPNLGQEPLILHTTDNSGEACSAIGLDVRVRGLGGCIPSSLTQLTPDEVAALPPADRP